MSEVRAFRGKELRAIVGALFGAHWFHDAVVVGQKVTRVGGNARFVVTQRFPSRILKQK